MFHADTFRNAPADIPMSSAAVTVESDARIKSGERRHRNRAETTPGRQPKRMVHQPGFGSRTERGRILRPPRLDGWRHSRDTHRISCCGRALRRSQLRSLLSAARTRPKTRTPIHTRTPAWGTVVRPRRLCVLAGSSLQPEQAECAPNPRHTGSAGRSD